VALEPVLLNRTTWSFSSV